MGAWFFGHEHAGGKLGIEPYVDLEPPSLGDLIRIRSLSFFHNDNVIYALKVTTGFPLRRNKPHYR